MIHMEQPQTSAHSRRLPALLTAVPAIAGAQLQQARGLLLAIAATLLLAVTLTAAIPPFSNVMLTAALRSALTAAPDSDRLIVSTTPNAISTSANGMLVSVTDGAVGYYLRGYLSSQREALLQVPGLLLLTPLPPPKGTVGPPRTAVNTLTLFGATMDTARTQTTVVQGRLPQDSAANVEIALTADTAQKLGVTVGGTLSVLLEYMTNPLTSGLPPQVASVELQLPVVGIFAPATNDDPFLNASTFAPQPEQGFAFTALASQRALLSTIDRITASAMTTVGTPVGTSFQVVPSAVIFQVYRLDVAHITIQQLDSLIAQMNALQVNYSTAPVNTGDFASSLTGGTLGDGGSLQTFRSQVQFPQIVMGLFLLQIVALVLLFICALANVLVERQEAAIGLLRSRGTTRLHIFITLGLEGLASAALAALVGTLLAIPAALWLASAVLSPADKGALNAVTSDVPGQALDVVPYALGMVAVAILALLLITARAARLNIVAARREAGRSSRRPAWQRMNLDVAAALVALLAFGVSNYLAGTVQNTEQSRVLLAPLTLAAPVLLAVAVALLAVRLFPWVLRGAAWLADLGRGVTPQLAFAQLARAPGQSLRTVLLLAFALALVIVTGVFAASQSQRLPDVASYLAAADFSGSLPQDIRSKSFDDLVSQYQQIRGVTSASLGYVYDAYQGVLASNVELQAVDTATYAQTVSWAWTDASQSFPPLLRQLVPSTPPIAPIGGVPALVDASLWNALHLHVGQTFTLDIAEAAGGPTADRAAFPFIAVAEIPHLPPLADDTAGVGSSDVVSGGLVVDYQTYATYYKNLEFGSTISPNFVWLRTVSDPAILAETRTALTQGTLHLDPLYDRRAIESRLQRDALYLDLTVVPEVGALLTLGLALVGIGISAWQSASRRLAAFALLRALGVSRGQIAHILWWEQVATYPLALGLGAAMGLGLAGQVTRSLVFSGITGAPLVGAVLGASSTDEFFARQHVPPVRIVYPQGIMILVMGLAGFGLVAAALMAWRVSRPGAGATLRFDED